MPKILSTWFVHAPKCQRKEGGAKSSKNRHRTLRMASSAYSEVSNKSGATPIYFAKKNLSAMPLFDPPRLLIFVEWSLYVMNKNRFLYISRHVYLIRHVY